VVVRTNGREDHCQGLMAGKQCQMVMAKEFGQGNLGEECRQKDVGQGSDGWGNEGKGWRQEGDGKGMSANGGAGKCRAGR
jgi:hypothetical protein